MKNLEILRCAQDDKEDMPAPTNGKSFWPKWNENILFTVILGILGAYMIVYVGTLIAKTSKDTDQIGVAPSPAPVITVDGTGKVTATPNIGTIQVGLLTEGEDVESTQEQNSAKMNTLLAELKKLGIADEDLQTANYSISPRYDYSKGKSEITGYQVSQSVTVKVRDITKLSDVFGTAGRLGANQVFGPTFTIDDEEDLKAQARAKAIELAKKKLVSLSRDLGVRPVRLVSFSESTGGIPPYFARAEALDVGIGGAPEIQPGQLEVEVSVSLTYEVR